MGRRRAMWLAVLLAVYGFRWLVAQVVFVGVANGPDTYTQGCRIFVTYTRLVWG